MPRQAAASCQSQLAVKGGVGGRSCMVGSVCWLTTRSPTEVLSGLIGAADVFRGGGQAWMMSRVG
jgi:hypothetical protein